MPATAADNVLALAALGGTAQNRSDPISVASPEVAEASTRTVAVADVLAEKRRQRQRALMGSAI